ncbi:MAG: hypothetical protein ABR595_01260 [Psychroflexus sp.]
MTSLPFAMQNLNYEALQKRVNDEDDKKINILKLDYAGIDSPLQIKSVTSSATTNLLQSADLEAKSSTIFDKEEFQIKFDKYITVNKIPIALNVDVFSNDTKMAEITVSRISYPKSGTVDFSIPENHKTIQTQEQIN